MKVKYVWALGAAALALSGLSVAAVNADEASEGPTKEVFAGCVAFPPAEEAYLENPNRTFREIQEAWAVNKHRYCAGVVVPAAEADNVAVALSICMEGEGRPWNLSELKECVALYERGELVVPDDAELARMMREAEVLMHSTEHPSKNGRHLKRKRHHRVAVAHMSAAG